MSKHPSSYGVLERLPPDIQYLKQVVWEGWKATQIDEDALRDGCCMDYYSKVLDVIRRRLQGLAPHEQVQEALRHRELIRGFTKEYPHVGRQRSEDHPETIALYFVEGLLEDAEVLFTNESI
jgi:hypothetical protein